MESSKLIGTILIAVGVLDAASAMWVPQRIPDERQRAIVRLALLSSGIVVIALGGLFLSGIAGRVTTSGPEREPGGRSPEPAELESR